MSKKCVHYGCGLHAPEGWENYDASPTLKIQRIPLIGSFFKGRDIPAFPDNIIMGDIVRGLSVKAGSVDLIYCSHILEHLTYADCKIALSNTYSYLKKDGIFRMVVPDLEYMIRQYVSSNDADAANKFMEDTSLGHKDCRRQGFEFVRNYLGNSKHLWMWDYKTMSAELKEAGFTGIRRAEFNDSENEEFKLVENEWRWMNCLGIEAKK